jgi:3-oxoacyl-[acyl-carrier-protein] synthase-3
MAVEHARENPIVRVASRISGAGMAVPEKVVPNAHFESYLETNDAWIRERTGIAQRYWAEPGMGVSEIAEVAARQAIENANLNISDIDGIVFATVTPDYIFPSAACCLQRRLGMTKGFAFDVNAVCSGFVYAFITADALIASGQAKHLLVVGADFLSQTVNKNDRTTCILFGDGCGAVLLEAGPAHGPGIIGFELHSDGSGAADLCIPCSGSALLASPSVLERGEQFVKQNGRTVFTHAIRRMSEVCVSLMKTLQLTVSDIDLLVPHQANLRIIEPTAQRLGLSMDKVVVNIERVANTTAGTIPLALADAYTDGRLKPGTRIMLAAFGGGLTWGALYLTWGRA